jgi:hypothetical protein
MATLLVAFDHGAVTIGDLLLGLSFCDDVVFLLPSALRTDPLVPLLAAAGRTFELSDDLVADLQGLKLLDPDGILTFSERMLAPTAGIAAGLGLPFHSPETVTGLTDKFRQRSVLASMKCRPD